MAQASALLLVKDVNFEDGVERFVVRFITGKY